MSKYFSVNNNSGEIVVDDSLTRLRLRQAIKLSSCPYTTYSCAGDQDTYTISSDYGICYSFVHTLTLEADDVFVAIKPTGNACSPYIGIVSDRGASTQAKIGILTKNNSGVTSDNITNYTQNIYVYIFTKKQIEDVSQQKYGIEIKNASGNVIFNSFSYLQNVVSVYSRTVTDFSFISYSEGSANLPLTASTNVSSTYAFCMNSHISRLTSVPFKFQTVSYGLCVNNSVYEERIFARGRNTGVLSGEMSPYGNLVASNTLWPVTNIFFIDVSAIPLPS